MGKILISDGSYKTDVAVAPFENIEEFLRQGDIPVTDTMTHILHMGGYDQYLKPEYVKDTYLSPVWDQVIKKGRYGEGYCARVDVLGAMENAYYTHTGQPIATGKLWIPHLCWEHTTYMGYNNLLDLSENTQNRFDQPFPNGYDCVLPVTTRAHVYQKPNSMLALYMNCQVPEWTPFNILTYYITICNGELRRYTREYNVPFDTYIVLGTVPNTVDRWYDIEIRQRPDTPLVPVDNPTIWEGSSLNLPSVDFTWELLIDGVVVVSIPNCKTWGYSVSTPFHYARGIAGVNNEVFLDNVYTVFMTDVGSRYLEEPKWVIRMGELSLGESIGDWVASNIDNLSDHSTKRNDIDIAVKLGSAGVLINDSKRGRYDDSDPRVCIEPAYTKFYYAVPAPIGSKSIAANALVMQNQYPTNSFDTEYYFPWVYQSQRGSKAIRHIGDPYIGIDKDIASGSSELLTATQRYIATGTDFENPHLDLISRTTYQFMPNTVNVGSLYLATDYVGGKSYVGLNTFDDE